MGTLQTNFVSGTLSAGIGNSDTTLASSGFANLPTVSGADIIKLILDPFGEDGAPEIVFVTTHAASATTVTGVLRGQDIDDNAGAARSHASGTLFIHAPVASDWQDVVARASNIINSPGSSLATGAPDGLVAGGPNVLGGATAVSRSDHKHALPVAAPAPSVPGDVQSVGAANEVSRADHQHARESFTADISDVASVENAGVAPTVARGDHAHRIGAGAIIEMAMFGGGVRGRWATTSTAMPTGLPIGSEAYLTDKKRTATLVSVGPDVWSYDSDRMPYGMAAKLTGTVADDPIGSFTYLTGFTTIENGGVTITTNGITIPHNGLWDLSAFVGFGTVSGSTMFRLFSVYVNNAHLNPGLTASGDAQASNSSGHGYSPGSVGRLLRLSTGNTIRIGVRHNNPTPINVSAHISVRQVGD